MSTRADTAPHGARERAASQGAGGEHGGPHHRRGVRVRSALAGVLAAGLTLGVAEVVASFVGRSAAPVLAIGSAFVDRVPSWLKELAIATFGTNDKTALLVSMGVVIAALAAAAGLLCLRDRRAGTVAVAALGAVSLGAALTRASAGALDALPTLVGFGVGVLVLPVLVDAAERSGGRAGAGTAPPATSAGGAGRRSFLVLASATALATVATGVGGRLLSGARQAVGAARSALRLPAPARPAPALADATSVGVDGVAPFVTPNADFYRIDTALRVPQIDPATWSLRVHGLVEREVELSFDELVGSDLVERWTTMTCVSNVVGGDLVGNARWLGLPIAALLARAGVRAGADMVLSTSVDGFTASTPLEALADPGRGAILAVGMNGDPLPVEHGFPVRMVIPGLYGYVSATKWVVDLEVTRFADATAYWTDRGWSARGPIKTASRIDVPEGFARVPAGTVAVAGSAWAQTRGISAVEVQVDDGPWEAADLGETPNPDTWVQWSWAWSATEGQHTLRVRAVDGDGEVQTGERVDTVPDGATGHHSVVVTVT